MNMTDDLIKNIITYIENDPELSNNLDYLLQYKFKSLADFKNKTLKTAIADPYIGGLKELCKNLIFERKYFSSGDATLNNLANYVIQYLAWLVAMDLFVGSLDKDSKMKDIRSFNGDFNSVLNLIGIAFEKKIFDSRGKVIDKKVFAASIEIHDVGVPVPTTLDLVVKVTVRNSTGGEVSDTMPLRELNKSKFVDLVKAAGWL